MLILASVNLRSNVSMVSYLECRSLWCVARNQECSMRMGNNKGRFIVVGLTKICMCALGFVQVSENELRFEKI